MLNPSGVRLALPLDIMLDHVEHGVLPSFKGLSQLRATDQ